MSIIGYIVYIIIFTVPGVIAYFIIYILAKKEEEERRKNLTSEQKAKEERERFIETINNSLVVGEIKAGFKKNYSIHLLEEQLYLKCTDNEIISLSKDFVKSYEFFDSNKKVDLGHAVVGGIVAGGAGAIIVSNTGQKKYLILITWINNDEKSIISLNETGFMIFKLLF